MTTAATSPIITCHWRRDGTPRPPRPLNEAVAAIFAVLKGRVPREVIRQQLLAGETVQTEAAEWRLSREKTA